MKPIVYHAEASAELRGESLYYESCSQGLGEQFFEEVKSAVERIQDDPERWPRFRRTNTRFHRLHRFPFVIYFEESETEIWIMAVAHGRRRPGYWRNRKRS